MQCGHGFEIQHHEQCRRGRRGNLQEYQPWKSTFILQEDAAFLGILKSYYQSFPVLISMSFYQL